MGFAKLHESQPAFKRDLQALQKLRRTEFVCVGDRIDGRQRKPAQYRHRCRQ
jgi:hypothetical protein